MNKTWGRTLHADTNHRFLYVRRARSSISNVSALADDELRLDGATLANRTSRGHQTPSCTPPPLLTRHLDGCNVYRKDGVGNCANPHSTSLQHTHTHTHLGLMAPPTFHPAAARRHAELCDRCQATTTHIWRAAATSRGGGVEGVGVGRGVPVGELYGKYRPGRTLLKPDFRTVGM